jgi:F-type H+-transporting ATPase subunit epsilon
MTARLQLKILQPYATFVEESEVIRIVAETAQGSFGILPNRLDCAAVLTAGIFCYQCANSQEVYIAVDQGVLVKTGLTVMVSVHRALGQAPLSQLHALVKQEFQVLDEQAQRMHATKIKLEAGFLRQLSNFRRS